MILSKLHLLQDLEPWIKLCGSDWKFELIIVFADEAKTTQGQAPLLIAPRCRIIPGYFRQSQQAGAGIEGFLLRVAQMLFGETCHAIPDHGDLAKLHFHLAVMGVLGGNFRR